MVRIPEGCGEQPLTPAEAAKLCRLTADYVCMLSRQDKLRNVGRPNAPRVRRADLPVKALVAGA
jgi:hypothetical protein